MKAIQVRCPAKVNLTLEILGKRADGYHELRTVFQAVSLYDELTVAPAERDTFTVTGLPGVPADENNLCLKALRLFRSRFDMAAPVAIGLHKRIPLQAGLGGGSSDAAGTLAALEAVAARFIAPDSPRDENWRDESRRYAAHLGSDVAFFLHGGAMLGAGRGDELSRLPALTEGAFVLALPPVTMSTAEAYSLIRPEDYTDGSRTERLARQLRAGCALPEAAAEMYNVFAAPVERYRPEIAGLRQRLLTLDAQAVLLCGSGAAVLGVWEEVSAAADAVRALEAAGLWAVAVRPAADGLQVTEQ